MTIVHVWIAAAAVGLVVQSALIWDSLHTLAMARVEKLENGGRRRVLYGHLRSGCAYWLIHFFFLYIGLAVVFRWQQAAVIRWGFIAAAVLLVLAGLADYRDRHLLRKGAK